MLNCRVCVSALRGKDCSPEQLKPIRARIVSSMSEPMIRSLFEEPEERPVTVSELTAGIKNALERKYPSVWVEGEITNFHSAVSGHWYFSLSDGDAIIRAACFKGSNYKISYKPANGDLVRVRGRISVYEKRGDYQLIAESLAPSGAGALSAAFEQVKAKLEAEGLFDESAKRPLPPFPRRIGIVTSRTGAAVHDILTVLRRRARSVSAIVVPTLVQGAGAGSEIASAIEFANVYSETTDDENKIDVLIVGRGGGSAEDLWAFNEEIVARAIRASAIPVISAVGHEIDFSIADFAADLRAATPSAAAEIVAESEDVVFERIGTLRQRLEALAERSVDRFRQRVDTASDSYALRRFPERVKGLSNEVIWLADRNERAFRELLGERKRETAALVHRLSPERLSANLERRKGRLQSLAGRTGHAMDVRIAAAREQLSRRMAALDALSPLKVLTRGYALARDESGSILRDAGSLSKGDLVTVKLLKGSFESEVVSVRNGGDPE